MLPITPDMSLLDRMVLAVARVRDKLARATAALEAAGILYAVAGDCAVAAWVASVDEGAVRNAKNVAIILRRIDAQKAFSALATAGFHHQSRLGADYFLDGAEDSPDSAIRLLFAGEFETSRSLLPIPDASEAVMISGRRILELRRLVEMMLSTFRSVDCMHLRDLLDVGLVDQFWPRRSSPELAVRLQLLIDTPEM